MILSFVAPAAQAAPDTRDRTAAIASALHLSHCRVVSIAPAVSTAPAVATGMAEASMRLQVPIDGEMHDITLSPQSVRASGFHLTKQLGDGSYVAVEPGPVTTYRGRVEGFAGSAVAASIDGSGVHAMILLPNRDRIWLEPVPAAAGGAAVAGEHILYEDGDVMPSGETCGVVAPGEPDGLVDARFSADSASAEGVVAGTNAGTPLSIAEVATDADVQYFLDYGSVDAVASQIERIINAVNTQYERDVNIRFIVTEMIVRTAEPDPYTSNDAESRLNQFRSHWEFAQVGVQRDMAQLFTGEDMVGATIGIAWLGENRTNTVCGPLGYSLVQSNCSSCGLFARKTDLSAHEFGHNWGAGHCSCGQPNPYTMNPSITGANRFHPTFSIPDIESYRDTRNCLEQGDRLRRLFLSAESGFVDENAGVQLTATADFEFGPNEDVTLEVDWTVDPAIGLVDFFGRYRGADVTGDTCVTVEASYTFGDVTRTSSVTLTVRDLDSPLAVIASNPPDGAIDARTPLAEDGVTPVGWRAVEITVNGEVCSTALADFAVTVDGATASAPAIADVQPVGERSFRVTLTGPVAPPPIRQDNPAGVRVIVTHVPTGISSTVHALPGDVDGNGVSNAADTGVLLDVLDGVLAPLPEWATDINRSGRTLPNDIIEHINLLNGAAATTVWNGASLP